MIFIKHQDLGLPFFNVIDPITRQNQDVNE